MSGACSIGSIGSIGSISGPESTGSVLAQPPKSKPVRQIIVKLRNLIIPMSSSFKKLFFDNASKTGLNHKSRQNFTD
jgi:hypothetical protein